MTAEKPECMRVAKQFGQKYWDGDRKYGFGGYQYDGRWKPVAEAMVKHYGLKTNDRILDIGCGKGFLLSDISKKCNLKIQGIDISEYAKSESILKNDPYFDLDHLICDCRDLIFRNTTFDLTYSINVFHNLCYKDLKQAIREMVRVSKYKMYICVESYRNEEELTNLQAWQLTCLSYYSPDDWLQIYEDCGYKGDYEFIYFT